jgi:hypothetical protein
VQQPQVQQQQQINPQPSAAQPGPNRPRRTQ